MGKEQIKVVVLVLIIVVAFVIVFRGLVCNRLGAQKTETVLYCTSCNKQFTEKIKMSEEGLYKCAKCGKKTAKQALACANPRCGLVLAAPDPPADGSPMPPPTCSRCGSFLQPARPKEEK